MAHAPYVTSVHRMKLLAEMEEQFLDKNVP
jgi:hypothetical protein